MSIATPKEFEPDKNVVKESNKSTTVELTRDPFDCGSKNADVVVTDTYSSIHNRDPKRIAKIPSKISSKLRIDEVCEKKCDLFTLSSC